MCTPPRAIIDEAQPLLQWKECYSSKTTMVIARRYSAQTKVSRVGWKLSLEILTVTITTLAGVNARSLNVSCHY